MWVFSGVRLGMVGTVLLKNIQDTKTPQKQTKQKKDENKLWNTEYL